MFFEDFEDFKAIALLWLIISMILTLNSCWSKSETPEDKIYWKIASLKMETLPYKGEIKAFVILNPETFFREEIDDHFSPRRKSFLKKLMNDAEFGTLCTIYHVDDESLRTVLEKKIGNVDIILVNEAGETMGIPFHEAAENLYRVKSFFRKEKR